MPLKDLVDLVHTVKAGVYSIQAANPRHAHEWEVKMSGCRTARSSSLGEGARIATQKLWGK